MTRLGENLQIKRFQLQFNDFIDRFGDFSEVDLFRVFRTVAESAGEVPEVDAFRQGFIALPLDVLIDFVPYRFDEPVSFDFRVGQLKCFFHRYPEILWEAECRGENRSREKVAAEVRAENYRAELTIFTG
jgi:hypothetical protein